MKRRCRKIRNELVSFRLFYWELLGDRLVRLLYALGNIINYLISSVFNRIKVFSFLIYPVIIFTPAYNHFFMRPEWSDLGIINFMMNMFSKIFLCSRKFGVQVNG
jgi:hypothetical protein